MRLIPFLLALPIGPWLVGCAVSDPTPVAADREPPHAAVTFIFECISDSETAMQRPSVIIVGCADSGAYLDGLVWHDWGADAAQAEGRMVVTNCDPSCAEGTDEATDVTVTASRLRYREATAVYKLLTVTVVGDDTLGFDRVTKFRMPG